MQKKGIVYYLGWLVAVIAIIPIGAVLFSAFFMMLPPGRQIIVTVFGAALAFVDLILTLNLMEMGGMLPAGDAS